MTREAYPITVVAFFWASHGGHSDDSPCRRALLGRGLDREFLAEKYEAMRNLPIVVILGLASGAAAGAEFEVHQAGRVFTPAYLVVGKGSIVHFANDEKFVHHAFVDTPHFKADTGYIPPGESRAIMFTLHGIYSIRCAIHPQMKMTVEVIEQE